MKRVTKREYVAQLEALGCSRETKTILGDQTLTQMEREGYQFFIEEGAPQIWSPNMRLERALRL